MSDLPSTAKRYHSLLALNVRNSYDLSPHMHTDEKGWEMCRYYFGDGRCANPKVNDSYCQDSRICKLSSKLPNKDETCSDDESWYGLYCMKYKRFFCPGKDNCQTHELYAESLKRYLSQR